VGVGVTVPPVTGDGVDVGVAVGVGVAPQATAVKAPLGVLPELVKGRKGGLSTWT
jgi:hypothetical protein